MTDLVEFLRARLDEDEATAQSAASTSGPAWRYRVILGEPDGYSLDLSDERVLIVDWADKDELLPSEAEHIARHDPARVLREVEAKRRIIERCASAEPSDSGDIGRVLLAEETLRNLAEPYANHPDYREGWKP